MMLIAYFVATVFTFLTVLYTMTRALHMLQLNSYFNGRYLEYLKENFTAKSAVSVAAGIICAAALFLPGPWGFIVLAGVLLFRIYAVYKQHKNAKKKLVYTARVKRMMMTWGVLSILAAGTLLLIWPGETALRVYTAAIQILPVITPFVAILVNIINHPAEWGVKQYYINDAKKILASMPHLKIIGITGSYGKTSTKYVLGRLLSEKYNVTITPESFNTPMGVVRTIRENLKNTTEIFVVEMGAKKTGDIKEICDLVHPHMGIITSVGPQHLNTFGSIENVLSTKFELADAVAKNGGMMYLNTDNEWIAKKASEYTHVGYGLSENAEVRASSLSSDRHGSAFKISRDKTEIEIHTKLLGRHAVLNILSAVSVALDLGVNMTDVAYAAKRLEAVEHRLQMKPFLNGSILIDDAYNANPSGSLEALSVLGSFAPMKRIVVTPGLVELGEKEYECNKALGKACAENCDQIILVGISRSVPLADGVKETGFNEQNLNIVETFNDAAIMLRTLCDAETVVLFENDLPDNYAK